MSKVYEVWNQGDPEYGKTVTYVQAETVGKAKVKALVEFEDTDFVELRAKRIPWADGLDNIDNFDYPFQWHLLHHGYSVCLGVDYQDCVDPEDVPMIAAYGGLKDFDMALVRASVDKMPSSYEIEMARDLWGHGKMKLGDDYES
ncbi:hypothetical protein [Schleiferilactobacillus perolens]|nr:hypothetical protein [Schleiferilactobacillus perolens]